MAKEILESDRLVVDRIYNQSIVYWDRISNGYVVSNKQGKITNESRYLNIIWHKNAKELLGVHFIYISKESGMRLMRLYDVLDETGNIKTKNVKVSSESLAKYNITESTLYRRNAYMIEIKNDRAGRSRTYVDTIPLFRVE